MENSLHSKILEYACDINQNRRVNTDSERDLIQDKIDYFRKELNIYFRMKYGKDLIEWFKIFIEGNPWAIINDEDNEIMKYVNSINLLNQLEYLLFINQGI